MIRGTMDIKFIGAKTEVTGSMTLLSNSMGKILIDSGLHQGLDEFVKRNKDKLPFEPSEIVAIILTHAHLDHSGLIPRLVKNGFRGSIYCTKPTMKLAKLIMADSASIMEKNKDHLLHGFYSLQDVMVTSSLFKIKEFHEIFEVIGYKVEFFKAGHILGAASVVLKGEDKTIVFSGDLGRSNDPILESPEACPPADIVMMESTYGGKIRSSDCYEELKSFLIDIKEHSRVGIIASFAVARGQMLITLIHRFYNEHPEFKVRVVVDGPMMVHADNVYKEFSEMTKVSNEIKLALGEVEVVEHLRQWETLQKNEGPLIVIASSGMVSGGRVLRYLENWQQDENACLFLPGYQGEGTSGRLLAEGKRIIHDEKGHKIHWHGKVKTSEAFSSHADQSELINWLKNVNPLSQIYLNHGEYESKIKLQKKLKDSGFNNVELTAFH
jgi:metallo-beta-lactamase family protein